MNLQLYGVWGARQAAPPPRTEAAPLPNGGNCAMQGCDTPATRRQRASHGAKPPPPPVSSALQGPRVRLGHRWVAETRQLHTRKVPRRNKSRPTRTTPRRFGTKLSQHTPSHRMCGTKLSQHTRNGPIWRFFYMQGEFYTVVTTKKLSRENFVPNAGQSWGSPTGHQAPPAWRVPEGPVWRARAGFEAQSLAAVPVGGGGARPQYPQTTAAPRPDKFRT